MDIFYLFIGIYIIVFSLYMMYFFFRNKRKVQNKMIEVLYMEKKYNMDLSNVEISKLHRFIASINSLIIVLTLFIMEYFDIFIIKVILAFVLVFVLIIILYGILGLYYKKRVD